MARLKIGWVLSGDRRVAGSRLQGFLMHEMFLKMGVESELLHVPEGFVVQLGIEVSRADEWVRQGFSCIVFQKVAWGTTEDLAKALQARGVVVLFLACNLFGQKMVELSDATIATSDYLKRTYRHRNTHKITVVGDPIEVPEQIFKRDYRQLGERLRLVSVAGLAPSPFLVDLVTRHNADVEWIEISSLAPVAGGGDSGGQQGDGPVGAMGKIRRMLAATSFHDLPWKVQYACLRKREQRRMANAKTPRVKPIHVEWDLATVYDHVLSADVAVIPCELNTEWALAKSANRLTMMMALGMPTIVSPLPAYRDVLSGVRGGSELIASTPHAWGRAIDRLRDERRRTDIGMRFRAFARARYSPEVTARAYLAVLQSLVAGARPGD